MIYVKFLNNKRQSELNILMSKYYVVKMPRVSFARITKNNASIYSLVFDENMVDVYGEDQAQTQAQDQDLIQNQDQENESTKNYDDHVCKIIENENKEKSTRISLKEIEMKLENYFRDNDNVQRLYQEDIDQLHEALLKNDSNEENSSSYFVEEDEDEKIETKRFVSRTKAKSRSKVRRK